MTARRSLTVHGTEYDIACLRSALAETGGPERLPASICILLEMLLRAQDFEFASPVLAALRGWPRPQPLSVPFRPARVLLQDYTGIPVLVDLAALQQEAAERGLPRDSFRCVVQSDLIIDHSLSVDVSADPGAAQANAAAEMARNRERFTFLKWAEQAFPGLHLFPPGSGICHQINMERLATVVAASPPDATGRRLARPDTVLGADSHTTTINGLGVLGWGVGGLEALTALLGNPVTMALPDVLGVRLVGALPDGTTATDLVLSLVQRLRTAKVVGRFVEFFGPGLAELPAAHRATVANMAPEAGATCLFFPVDAETLRYLSLTGRTAAQIALVESYCRAQGLWREADAVPEFAETIEFDLSVVGPSLAGPGRPEQHLTLSAAARLTRSLAGDAASAVANSTANDAAAAPELQPGDVVLAAITSCTNTANAHSVMTAGLLARNAVCAGLTVPPWVKTSFAPGSRAVAEYLRRSGLQEALDTLGFGIVGFGCTTCIGNAGPLKPGIEQALAARNVAVSAVLSGNRNFANRVHPAIPSNFLASPALVVAYALAGSTAVDLTTEPIGIGRDGRAVTLSHLWPSRQEIEAAMAAAVGPEAFHAEQEARAGWGDIDPPPGPSPWHLDPTTVRRPPIEPADPSTRRGTLRGLRILGMFGDKVTTDHISPASPIRPGTPAGDDLLAQGVARDRLHTFGARRGNWATMLLGAFTNPDLHNEMTPGLPGAMTRHWPDGAVMSMQEAARHYRADGTGLVLVAGREYGTGSSRDDAAKSTRFLGVVAVIAESFERIHRANLLAMGVLPLAFPVGIGRAALGWTGEEVLELDLSELTGLGASVPCHVAGQEQTLLLTPRIETEEELAFWRAGGLMPFLLDRAEAAARAG
ncbi:aconitate hydratase AcnA [Roseomonas chloroacetimidivorans]|uniref:aconitate hydratase AcnA n=1 Tax=Roseomonas chloroacetimidivorans TaxID=1766656 RepID=UPI003C796A5D